jgi:hypothetical protein
MSHAVWSPEFQTIFILKLYHKNLIGVSVSVNRNYGVAKPNVQLAYKFTTIRAIRVELFSLCGVCFSLPDCCAGRL